MSSATLVGNSDASGAPGFCPAPPPPPPPPGVGQMPAMRINTETPALRRPMPSANDPYEPPAAIQNAMMTKDKKPFTYTPGMGGKLDLSQIRSPRMARRVAKNANDEGIEGPPKSPLAAEQSRPVSTGANLFVQPQVAVPVFPTNAPQVTRPLQVNRTLSNAGERGQETPTPKPTVKIESRPSSQPTTPDTPTSPTQVNLNKAPTPWMQKNVRERQEELPEWARRSNGNGSASYSPPQSPPESVTFVPQSPVSQQQQRPLTQMRSVQTQPGERVIPLCVEDRPSVFAMKNDHGASGHHQLKQTPPHHQSRWYAPQNSQNQVPAPRPVSSPPASQPQSGGTYIVPMRIEGKPTSPPVNSQYQQPAWNDYSPSGNQGNRGNFQQRSAPPIQAEPGPVQSRSFRVLQKITDTDDDDVDVEQVRKLQLTEDDKLLMSKFKEQVDGDTYLHQEEDPRYRGAAIPSRAFRYLQNMTDDGANTNAAPARNVNSALKKQNRNSRTFDEPQSNVPASEQQVQEPKKYTGSAIPSRSFRILQAMTTPESVGPDTTDY
uniref:Uncharacterized protein n=1 Tax=Fopius arisanus TaxID=64838 RepID=A0A0C9QD24_9HYME